MIHAPRIPKRWQDAIWKATCEGRIGYRVTDQYGCPCNGGQRESVPFRRWSEKREVSVYRSGWHLTTNPSLWNGCRVWVVEGRGRFDRSGDKTAWEQIRVLAEVDYRQCLDVRAFVRCAPSLVGVDLSGSNLSGSNLRGSNLSYSNLSGSNLSYSNLSGSALSYSNLSGSNLSGSYLSGSNLSGSNLSGSYLSGSDLRGSNLSGSDRSRANFSGANMDGAIFRDEDY